jgi:signal transduction histidine kinase
VLHEFVMAHRAAIIAKTRLKLSHRPWPPVTVTELDSGVPLFLTQLSETLRLSTGRIPSPTDAIGASATRHGGELLALGFSVSQVVHAYGDICQAITELAVEENAAITNEEFHTLNRCLDTAIAEAVTEHARVTAQSRSTEEIERSGQLAHEIRNIVNTALVAFETLKRGTVAINGSTGAVLGRSLVGLRDMVDSALSDIRMAGNHQRRERTSVADFLGEIGAAATLHAEYRTQHFSMEPVPSGLAFNVDPQLLASAVMNLLNNAFKYTHAGGRITLRAYREDRRVRIEVEDQCGGIADSEGDPFRSFAERRGNDRSGLGLGLSIARRAVRAHGGDIHIRNAAGKGCVFVVDVPLAGEEAPFSYAGVAATIN